tara:strand:+ start:677 stop:1099 length:423 start_codon:yes stop_codon:yes gene_type:complete
MNTIKKQDLKYGFSNEQRVKPQLDIIFGELIDNNIKNKFSKIDFQNDMFGVEYKRRRITFGQYPTLFFEEGKIMEGWNYVNNGKRVFFIWECNDGLFYWELQAGEYYYEIGGRTDRGFDERKRLANIKLEYIKPLSELIF